MAKRSSIEVRLRIDFAPSGSVGPGKIALLEAIEASGSLSQAARELGMSYRRAWGLLDDLNRALREPAASASVGGAGGGGAKLTKFGRALIAAYREVERIAAGAAKARFASREAAKTPARRGGAALRRPLTRPLAKPRAARRRATKRR
ncbi:MAG TPA: LysR family transcriptional regulator [Myxococcota bacterium]|nr:LysR family transcriptional regulator [Myxococcota bacterium]